MATIGFTHYDIIPAPTQPTIQELIDSLTGAQKTAILNGFVKKTLPKQLAYDTPGLSKAVIIRLYRAIDDIEETSRTLMRGERLITPAEYDPDTGEEITPAVYNTPPSTAAQLLAAVAAEFADVFTSAQVSAILTKMVNYSKYDGSGTWTFYKAEVVK